MKIQPLGKRWIMKFNYGPQTFEGRLASRQSAWKRANEIMSAMEAGDTLTLTLEGTQNERSNKTRNTK